MANKNNQSGQDSPKPMGESKYKDKLFNVLFSNPDNALSLLNAVAGKDFQDTDGLKVITLRDAVYINKKDDVSVLVNGLMAIFEQQSTSNPNMPYRCLQYAARQYEGWAAEFSQKFYSSKLVKIPAPMCFELYNGEKDMPDRFEKKLSDAFAMPSEGYEWTVHVININDGHNQELMAKCPTLHGYSVFVAKVREALKSGKGKKESIGAAVEFCIENGFLVEFLSTHEAEVCGMVLEELSMEKYRQVVFEDGWQEGKAEERLSSIRSLMETLNLSVQQAMDALKIPSGEREKYAAQLRC